MLANLILLVVFVAMFFWEIEKDKKKFAKQDREERLFVLKELKSCYERHNLDATKYDHAIEEIEKSEF